MSKVTWLIDTKLFHDSYERGGLFDALYDAKTPCDIVFTKHFPFDDDDSIIQSTFETYNPVVVYGTINFIKRVQQIYKAKHRTTSLMCFGFSSDIDCLNYITKFPADWFLNEKAVFVPFCRFVEQSDWWYEMFGLTSVFIRPNSGTKVFTGTVIPQKEFDFEINSLKQLSGVTDSTLIMVAPTKPIVAEIRYVVANRKVVHSSTYRHHSKIYHDGNVIKYTSQEADELAKKVAEWPWQPDHCYVIDVAVILDKYDNAVPKILEFNAFCAAGFYTTHFYDIVNAVNETALLVKNDELTLER